MYFSLGYKIGWVHLTKNADEHFLIYQIVDCNTKSRSLKCHLDLGKKILSKQIFNCISTNVWWPRAFIGDCCVHKLINEMMNALKCNALRKPWPILIWKMILSADCDIFHIKRENLHIKWKYFHYSVNKLVSTIPSLNWLCCVFAWFHRMPHYTLVPVHFPIRNCKHEHGPTQSKLTQIAHGHLII